MHLVVVGEGPTEETFTASVLRPHLTAFGFEVVKPLLINTSETARGGALSPQRVIRALRNTLRESSRTYVTTFFDLYGLDPDFPGVQDARPRNDPLEKSRIVEEALARAAIEASGCRADRFVPHIQPYEFEALLFSEVAAFSTVQPAWERFEDELQNARDGADTPEHINDGPDTHPSARLIGALQPKYKKPLHGSRIAASIGLARIRQECRHFDAWLTTIESLKPL